MAMAELPGLHASSGGGWGARSADRKITALTAVIARTKLYTGATMAGRGAAASAASWCGTRPAARGLVEAPVDLRYAVMPARTPTGMLRRRSRDEDHARTRARRRHVERQNGHDDRPRDHKGSIVLNSKKALPDESLPHEQVRGQDADRRGDRGRDRDLDRRPEGVPGGPGEDHRSRRAHAEGGQEVLERRRVVASPGRTRR